MRLIEPEQITKIMSDLYISEDAVNMTGEHQGLWVRFRAIEKAVSEIPTVDAVEVVRCKDCKHWHREIRNGIEYVNFSSCDLNHYGDGHNFYCADGKRRE